MRAVRLVPPDDVVITCPRCRRRVTMVSAPPVWLPFVWKFKAHPCHHRLNGDQIANVLNQTEWKR